MKIKKLKLKKEIVANLSDKESKQVRGGTMAITMPIITCLYDCTYGSNPCYP